MGPREVAKETKRASKNASINRVAEFESNAMANEDFLMPLLDPLHPRPAHRPDTETAMTLKCHMGLTSIIILYPT